MKRIRPENTDVVILCGGLGRRLKSAVGDRPKPMAEIDGRPFLDILIHGAAGFGFKRFILCIGYMGDVIKRHYRGARGSWEIIFSEEQRRLGTAGAIKNAESLIKSSPFLAMNGDSLCQVDLIKFIEFHFVRNCLASLVLAKTAKEDDYGIVKVGAGGQIIGFDEKGKQNGDALINAGVYMFGRDIFSLIPANEEFSLEKDLFPRILGRGFYGYMSGQTFIDIGTPERYEAAKRTLCGRSDKE